MQNGLLQECNSTLTVIERENYVPGLHPDFTKKGAETKLKELFVVGDYEECWKERSTKTTIWYFRF